MAVADELAGGEHGGHELRPVDHGVEPSLQQPDQVLAGIAPKPDRLFVQPVELLLGNIAIVAAQLLFGAQLDAVVGKLAFPALAMLARAIFAAIDGAFGAAPDILAEAAVDLVLGFVALGHRVLMKWSLSDAPSFAPASRRDRQVSRRSAGEKPRV